jgi:hypothetical protein
VVEGPPRGGDRICHVGLCRNGDVRVDRLIVRVDRRHRFPAGRLAPAAVDEKLVPFRHANPFKGAARPSLLAIPTLAQTVNS